MKNKTRLVVTHSVEILDQCDRVIVMDQGHIAENAPYEHLIVDMDSKLSKVVSIL